MASISDPNVVRVEAAGLSKRYGRLQALDAVSFSVARGEVFGYLGPNGAGKTTTINILCGLLHRDAGTVQVCGVDVASDPVFVKSRIGVVGDSSNLYPELSCRRNLDYLGELYGLARNVRRRRTEELLAEFGLSLRADDRFGTLSRGLQRRLSIAAALIHQPEVVFLDEPTVGLDVPSAKALRELIRAIHARGTTVFLTTHNLAEAESLCSRVAILVRGQILAAGSVSEVRSRFGKATSLSVAFSAEVTEGDILAACPAIRAAAIVDGAWRLDVANLHETLRQLAALAERSQAEIIELSTSGTSLEDAFLSVLQQQDQREGNG